eukprot:Skav236205  [mRNA]  locus=scaffold98:58207:74420:- [translate_table: standard]
MVASLDGGKSLLVAPPKVAWSLRCDHLGVPKSLIAVQKLDCSAPNQPLCCSARLERENRSKTFEARQVLIHVMAEGGDAPQHIQLKVKDQQGSEVQFKIKKTTPLRKLMDAYCSRLGLQASQVRFMVDGERIAADDTAEKLGLEDEDLIDVAMEQTGGR